MASYYAHKFHGRPTASGEIYDESRLTAAHPVLPFGTLVRVTNLNNNNSVILKVNDRGPTAKGRIIDVSYTAARELDFVRQGVAKVKVEVVKSD
jgi:rare lipoprotein A